MMKMGKIISFITVISILFMIPMTANAEQITFGSVLDEYAKAESEYKKNQQTVGNTQGQIQQDNAKIKSLKEEIEKMKEETTKLQQEIAESNLEIEQKTKQTKDLLVYLQMSQGENAYLEYIFGSESITDMVYRLSIVEQITDYNDKMIKELNALIKKNEDRKVELAKKEEDAEKRIENLNNEISRLNQTLANLNSLSPSLKEELNAKEKLVNYYKSEGCKNRSDIIGVDCAKMTANAVFSRPIKNGYVTSHTGYRWLCLPNCQWKFHKGIDLGSSTGKNTPIYSIGYGIISTIWNDSAGAICVNTYHQDIKGQNYTAVYCHLSRRASNLYVGMQVTPNTLLGYMGATGNVTGIHLHLEVYPCKLWDSGDKNCNTWNKYESYTKRMFDSGNYKGAESVISFPNKTYQTWYNK